MSAFELSKSLSNKVFITQKTEIEGRLDPNFYSPIFDLPKGKSFNRLKEVTEHIFHPPEYPRNFSESGMQLIRSQNVRPLGMSIHERPVFFSEEFLKDRKVVKAKKGDVLVVRSGVNAGDTAVVEKELNNAIIGADTLLIRCSDNLIPKFLQVYFFTNFGKKQMVKHVTGATNKHLNSENLKKVFIPNFTIEQQKAAIEIYETNVKSRFEKLQQSQNLLNSIDDYLLTELGITLPEADNSLENRMFTTMFNELESRIDPFYYLNEFKEIEKSIEESNWDVVALEDIFQINRGGSPRPINNYYTEDENGVNWVKIGDTKNDDKYIYSTKQKIKPEGARYSRKVEIGDFVLSNSMSFGRPYIMKIEGYIHDGWLLFRAKSNVNKDYLHSILSSKLIYKLFKKSTIGGVVDNLNINLAKKVKIPLPPLTKQTEIANHISDLRRRAKQLQAEAEAAMTAAKAEVERMILGE